MPSKNTGSPQGVSTMSCQKVSLHPRVVVIGSAGVGKTSIIHQFLYDRFPVDHNPTVEEMHRSDYEIGGACLALDILDTSGTYEFPAMRRLAIQSADAFILVYAINDAASFEDVSAQRELILQMRKPSVPIVVVGNKCDLEEQRLVRKEIAETVVTIDWENGFTEASAKTAFNIINIFKKVLAQAHICYQLGPAVERRRKSLPAKPTYSNNSHAAELKRHSCIVQ